MEYNDTVLANSQGELILLIDSSASEEIRKLANETKYHALNFIVHRYPKIDFYFSQEVFQELNARELSSNVLNMAKRALQAEGVSLDPSIKVDMGLYNSTDGKITSYKHNKISQADHNQILLCQNHLELTLLTNDHKLLRSAAPVLPNRIMDLQNLFELLINTENPHLRKLWQELFDHYMQTSNYKRPKTFRALTDMLPEGREPRASV
jgi:predicted nucleic acid-binding protein